MVNNNIATNDNFDVVAAKSIWQELTNYIQSHAGEENLNINGDLRNLLNDLNQILKTQSIPSNKAIGDVFEYWLALASKYADSLSDKKSNEIIEQLVRGGDTSNVVISGDNFDKDLVDLSAILGADNGKWKRIDESNQF
jgi:hypothetical protein